jgi:hypothetical protein
MNITKDQIRQLTPEQQETLASIEVQRVKKREQLLRQARHYRGQQWLPALALIPLYFIPTFTSQKWPPSNIALILSLILWSLIQFHAAGVNRRLDALMELLESDKNKDDHDA